MPKRALVVDDSRVARVTLGKFLVEYKLAVDMAESAEAALEYLASNPPPHVIFMDHMMPGMDGLQAVVAIKKNPDTAQIPIVMYTSKDGDLYMGQARALGAVGVLSKPINSPELQKIIQGLNLASDSSNAQTSASPAEKNPPVSTKATPAPKLDLDDFPPVQMDSAANGETASLVKRLFEEQRAKLKQDLQVHSELIVHKVVERLQATQASAAKTVQHAPVTLSAKIAWLALVIGLIGMTFMYLDFRDKAASIKALTENPTAMEKKNATATPETRDETNSRSVSDAHVTSAEDKPKLTDASEKQQVKSPEERNKLLKTIEWMANMNSGFGYDQTPLGDERLAMVSELVARLTSIDFRGSLRLNVHRGDFCLLRSDSGAFKLPSDDAPIQNCQLLSSPQEQLLPPRQSAAFSRFVAAAPYNNGNLRIEINSYGKERPLYKYPSISSIRSAGEWNKIASQNNRVEILILPATP